MYLRAKFEVFSIIIRSFRQGVILPTLLPPENWPLKSPPRLGLKNIKPTTKFSRNALQQHFINKHIKNAYIKGPTKRQCTSIKQAFIKNYHDIDDNYKSVPSPEIEVKKRTPKKKLKIKKLTVFYFYQQLHFYLYKKPSSNTCLQK